MEIKTFEYVVITESNLFFRLNNGWWNSTSIIQTKEYIDKITVDWDYETNVVGHCACLSS